MKQIILVNVSNKDSFNFKATALRNELNDRGRITDILPVSIIKHYDVRNKIAVFVKDHVSEFSRLGCKTVMIVDDYLAVNNHITSKYFCKQGFDAFVFPNQRAFEDYGQYCPANSLKTVIHNHIDPRHMKCKHDNFRIGYVGNKLGKGYENIGIAQDWFRDSNKFNCHLSIRKKRESLYKPCSKLATAVGCGANIVMTRDSSFIELLPEYPFYATDYKKEEVIKTIERARISFGSPTWQKAIKKILSLKDKLRFDQIFLEYLKLFEELS